MRKLQECWCTISNETPGEAAIPESTSPINEWNKLMKKHWNKNNECKIHNSIKNKTVTLTNTLAGFHLKLLVIEGWWVTVARFPHKVGKSSVGAPLTMKSLYKDIWQRMTSDEFGSRISLGITSWSTKGRLSAKMGLSPSNEMEERRCSSAPPVTSWQSLPYTGRKFCSRYFWSREKCCRDRKCFFISPIPFVHKEKFFLQSLQ